MVVIKMKDTCNLESKPEYCEYCPFWRDEEIREYENVTGFISYCDFSETYFETDIHDVYQGFLEDDPNKHVPGDDCPLISITKEDA